jgi:hypothetical protein
MRSVQYRIVVRGHLSDGFAATFDAMATELGRGETAFVRWVRDQAHPYGILECLRDFGLELRRVEKDAQ